jgi:hypothetical protein
MRAVPQRRMPDQTVHGIDRMIRNIETGRFERSLSALTAAGALITAAEIYFEHDSASFGNKTRISVRGTGTAATRRMCGACGRVMRARRSTRTPRPGPRSAFPGPPIGAAPTQR